MLFLLGDRRGDVYWSTGWTVWIVHNLVVVRFVRSRALDCCQCILGGRVDASFFIFFCICLCGRLIFDYLAGYRRMLQTKMTIYFVRSACMMCAFSVCRLSVIFGTNRSVAGLLLSNEIRKILGFLCIFYVSLIYFQLHSKKLDTHRHKRIK